MCPSIVQPGIPHRPPGNPRLNDGGEYANTLVSNSTRYSSAKVLGANASSGRSERLTQYNPALSLDTDPHRAKDGKLAVATTPHRLSRPAQFCTLFALVRGSYTWPAMTERS